MKRVLPLLALIACVTCSSRDINDALIAYDIGEAIVSAMQEAGYEQILREHNGRYTKHGWNHYVPATSSSIPRPEC